MRDLLEHHARRAVQLADDDALGAIDDERAEVGEQRQFAEIDLLLDLFLSCFSPPTSSKMRRASVALRGAEYVMSRSMHSSTEYFGSPRV